jgi:hypothetical protein
VTQTKKPSSARKLPCQTEIPALRDVEENLLGALMQSPGLWEPTIREECFSTALAKKVFREICAMRERGEAPELSVLVSNLRKGDRITEDDVPIIASWGDQLSGVPMTQAALRKIVSCLLERYVRRELLKAGETAANRVADMNTPVTEVLRLQTETVERLQMLIRSDVDLERGLDGAELLEELSRFIRRFVWLTDTQATVLALWVDTHTCFAGGGPDSLPVYLKRRKAIRENPSSQGPTLLLDETDATFKQNQEYTEALRGILNSGYARGGCATLCVGKGSEQHVEDFPTFGAKALAGLGRLPDTLSDRSIPIALKRKVPGAQVERFRQRQVKPAGRALAHKCASWAQEHLDVLKKARPELPQCLSDRRQDVVEPLLAIADQVGSNWPSQARESIAQIFDGPGAEDQSIGVQLLADIRLIFDEGLLEKIITADLLEKLSKVETSPWAEWNRGKPMTAPRLARLLRPFGIHPKDMRTPAVKKGYERNQFEDAWARYLPKTLACTPRPTFPAATPLQANIHAGETCVSETLQEGSVAASKSEESSVSMQVVAAVADQKGRDASLEDKGADLETQPRCYVHRTETEWWRRGGDLVCGRCHPKPVEVLDPETSVPALLPASDHPPNPPDNHPRVTTVEIG